MTAIERRELEGLNSVEIIGDEESDDESRENEIKELLAHAFSIEPLDEYEENHSGLQNEELQHSHDLHWMPGKRVAEPSGVISVDSNFESETITIVSQHKSHCPEVNATGDSNGNYEWATPDGGTVEEFKTLCAFRERQVQRQEATISALSTDKRSLTHQLALLRTEIVETKASEEEFRKCLRMKEDEVAALKETLQEALDAYENSKNQEQAAKDESFRNRLSSNIGKSTQVIASTKVTQTDSSREETWRSNEIICDGQGRTDVLAEELQPWKTRTHPMDNKLQAVETGGLKNDKETSSSETQTDETMETYKILGRLMEGWLREVEEATEKAKKADERAAEMETCVILLRRKFRALKKLVMVCRHEWKERESILIRKEKETSKRFYAFLCRLVPTFEIVEEGFGTMGKIVQSSASQTQSPISNTKHCLNST